ncbi:hypothetical protein Tco_0489075 [Tanacetum coccineum]
MKRTIIKSFQRNVLNEKVIISYDVRDSHFGVGDAGFVILNDVLVERCDLHWRGLSQWSLCVIRPRHLGSRSSQGERARQQYVGI